MQYLPNPDEQRWLTRYMRRLIENMGHEQFVLAPILEPSRKWFPEEWFATVHDAHLLTQRLMHYAGLRDLRFTIEGYIATDIADTESGDASGYFSGIRDGMAHFGLKQTTLTDPEVAAGTMAHEVAHAWRHVHRDRLEPAAKDQEEILTDITTVYLGFGVLTTNDTYRFRSEGNMREQRWASSSYGYLPLQAMSFLLGMQLAARARDEEISAIETQLEPNQRRAVLETIDEFASQDILDLLALPPRETWPEPDIEAHDIALIEPDARMAIEIENPADDPQRNRGQYVYRSERERSGSMQPQGVGFLILALLFFGVVLAAALGGNMKAAGFLGFFAFLFLLSFVFRKPQREYFCSDTDCRQPLTLEDTVCSACGGTIAENAEDALEHNAAAVEFTECADCEPELPCERHAS
ncbi:MAG TPA: hypothetical protein VHW00_00450 [Thermoanaerobaculia bacterium]|nr:hypothetical protein [Thermoanaerobaculia bacterium]